MPVAFRLEARQVIGSGAWVALAATREGSYQKPGSQTIRGSKRPVGSPPACGTANQCATDIERSQGRLPSAIPILDESVNTRQREPTIQCLNLSGEALYRERVIKGGCLE